MMVSIESAEGLTRRMRVEVPADIIDAEIQSRLRSVGKTAKIAGFRPGKVPRKVIQQRYGGKIRQEVLSEFMQSSYSQALQQQRLMPAGAPQIEPQSAADGLSYVATFEVFPEITLNDLSSLEIVRPAVGVTEADVDAMLENLRAQKATWEVVERPSKIGDKVLVDFDGTIAGEPIPNGKGENVEVVLGEGRMLKDFETALTGVVAGEEKSFVVSYPADYPSDDLAGKTADFSARVHSINELKRPELDDALAVSYGVEDGGVDKLREGVTENMHHEVNMKVRNDVKEQAFAALLAGHDLAVPGSLVDREIHTMQHEAMRRMGVEDHDQAPPADDFREAAERRVKLGLLIQAFVEQEGIELDEARIRSRVEEMFAGYEDPAAIVEVYMGNPQLRQQIEPMVLEEQAVEVLISKGTEKSCNVSFKEYMD